VAEVYAASLPVGTNILIIEPGILLNVLLAVADGGVVDKKCKSDTPQK